MLRLLSLSCIVSLAGAASAATRYVDINNPVPSAPYTNWSTAATNIQDAVDAAVAGDQVLVNDGVYATGARFVTGSNRVAITKAVAVQSVNGPSVTVIQGYQTPGIIYGTNAVRCVFLTNGATLSGFTLTNGATSTNAPQFSQNENGGGVLCLPFGGASLSNCICVGNSAYVEGGGVCGGVLDHCLLCSNTAFWEGGGASYCTVNNSLLISNFVTNPGPPVTFVRPCDGGGAAESTLTNCTVYGNSAPYGGGVGTSRLSYCAVNGNSAWVGGGGTYGSPDTLEFCVVSNNSAPLGAGIYGGVLSNCKIISNTASPTSWNAVGQGGGAAIVILYNCAIVGNSASQIGGGTYNCNVQNSIIYLNSAPTNSNGSGGTFVNCCTSPLPSGSGCFTNEPLFVDLPAGDLRLKSNSPCINAGNNSYVSNSIDLNGFPRMSGGTVDLGPYEYQNPTSAISYAWLQQFGLATDGSADYADADSDRMNNWQEWRAGTNPRDASSCLRLLSPAVTQTNVSVRWLSVTGRTYYLQRCSNVATLNFFTLQSNIAGQTGTTSYADTTATNSQSYFYRVGVQ